MSKIKILFLTLLDFENIEERNIYTDLLRKFYHEGHSVYIVSPVERRKNGKTRYIQKDERLGIVKLKIGNIQKTNIIEKGISTLLLEYQVISAIKSFYSKVKFDLVLYSTPPITLQKAINYVKKRDGATTYLMLKDIFPQNAVDLGMLDRHGVKGMLYKYFRNKEKKLYRDSDFIGCMSEANMKYVINNNPAVDKKKVILCPNCIEPSGIKISQEEKKTIRDKYGIPNDKVVYIYGGNLGKPQGVPFIIQCLQAIEDKQDAKDIFLLVIGSGTEYSTLEKYLESHHLKKTKLLPQIPKKDFELVVKSCDVGLVFLDWRFLIPNFPSRILSYMDAELPILVSTDENSDLGSIVVREKMGCWGRSNDVEAFTQNVVELLDGTKRLSYGANSYAFFRKNYTVDKQYREIMRVLDL